MLSKLLPVYLPSLVLDRDIYILCINKCVIVFHMRGGIKIYTCESIQISSLASREQIAFLIIQKSILKNSVQTVSKENINVITSTKKSESRRQQSLSTNTSYMKTVVYNVTARILYIFYNKKQVSFSIVIYYLDVCFPILFPPLFLFAKAEVFSSLPSKNLNETYGIP